MDKPTRWSYSSLSTFEECPAKWKYSYIDNLPEPPSPAMERGTLLHKHCESVLDGTHAEVPAELAKITHILERLKVNNAQPEKPWRLNALWSPVESKSWLLAIVDVHFLKGDVLHVYDFKSGRSYPSHAAQLELYALIGLAHYPEASEVQCGAIYIDTGKLTRRRTILRADSAALMVRWTDRASALFAETAYSPKRGSGCYWCAFKDSLGGPCSAWRNDSYSKN